MSNWLFHFLILAYLQLSDLVSQVICQPRASGKHTIATLSRERVKFNRQLIKAALQDSQCKVDSTCYQSTYILPFNTGSQYRQQDLYIAALMPDKDDDVFHAIDQALHDINAHKYVLPNHTLKFMYSITKCNESRTTKQLFDMAHFRPSKFILFAAMCPRLTGTISQTSLELGFMQISYSDTDPKFSEQNAYNNLFRASPSDLAFNPARLAILKHFKWNRVACFHQTTDAVTDIHQATAWHNMAYTNLEKTLTNSNITFTSTSFNKTGPDEGVQKLKSQDVHIIFGNFDASMRAPVFCAAYKHKLYGDNVLWLILNGKVEDEVDRDYPWWIRDANTTACTPEEIIVAANFHLITESIALRTSKSSDLDIENFRNSLINTTHMKTLHSSYAYDAVWAAALAKHSEIKVGINSSFRTSAVALNNVLFQGVTGEFSFDRGDRKGLIELLQFFNGSIKRVGTYDAHRDSFKVVSSIHWPNGRTPPLDHKNISHEILSVNSYVYITIVCFSGLGIIFAIFLMTINIRYRKHRYIKMSSPKMNNLIIVGCMTAYSSVILLGTDSNILPYDPTLLDYMCSVRAGILSLSFTLSFGAIFSKTWRVHAIFTNITTSNKKVIKDYQLLALVGVLLLIDAIILIFWVQFDPMEVKKILKSSINVNGSDIVKYHLEYCDSKHQQRWLGIIYAYKGFLLLIGCYLAWSTRNVSIPALNDSKYIGISVYNVVLSCVSGAVINVCLDRTQSNSAFYIIAIFIIFCTTNTLGLVFVPKLLEIRRDPNGCESRIRATLKKQSKITQHDSEYTSRIKQLYDNSISLRRKLEELEKVYDEGLQECELKLITQECSLPIVDEITEYSSESIQLKSSQTFEHEEVEQLSNIMLNHHFEKSSITNIDNFSNLNTRPKHPNRYSLSDTCPSETSSIQLRNGLPEDQSETISQLDSDAIPLSTVNSLLRRIEDKLCNGVESDYTPEESNKKRDQMEWMRSSSISENHSSIYDSTIGAPFSVQAMVSMPIVSLMASCSESSIDQSLAKQSRSIRKKKRRGLKCDVLEYI